MKVCMLAYTFYEGDNRVMRYAEALTKRGDQVDVIALRRKGQPHEELVNGVRIFRIQERAKDEKGKLSYLVRVFTFFIHSCVALTARHIRQRYRLIHVHSVPDFLVFTAWIPRLMGARVILDIHDLLPELYGSKFGQNQRSLSFRLLVAIERFSCSFADHVIIANHLWRDRIASRSVMPDKCSVFMNSPDRSIFQMTGNKHTNGKFVMLYPGSLSWHQGLDIAIRAFAKIEDQCPHVEFHIYGEGATKPELIRLTHQLGLERRVLFLEPVPLREISRVIENADLGVVPKRKDSFGDEAFSTKTLEFMSLGVPIIVADTKIDRYYFDDRIVTFFTAGNDEDLARCMVRLIRDPEARRTQAQNAMEFVVRNDWESKKEEYFQLVNTLTKGKTNRA